MLLNKYQELQEFLRAKASDFFHKYSVPRWMLFIHDIVAVFITFLFAYLLRFNLIPADFPKHQAIVHALITLSVYTIFIIIFRSFAGLLRHTTLTDVSLVFISNTSAAAVLVLFSMIANMSNFDRDLIIPLSVLLIHYVLISVFLFSMRISIKMFFRFASSSLKVSMRRVLIYGAGEMGFVVKRVILSDPRGGFSVAGFIDDSKILQGKKINGIQVYSSEILSTKFLQKKNIKTLILAIRTLSPSRKSEIIRTAIDQGLEILETPAVEKWLNGQLEMRQLQKVMLEDLLGRDPIKLNMELIRKGLTGKTILVTGAAGSIGSEIVRQLSRFITRYIILVDQAETPMFHIENELRKKYGHVKFKTQLADITNVEKMEQILREFQPEIVFHAAAYKHVPLMEENPHEAIRVNIGGTRIITELSVKYGVRKFVMISSDKSVNPTNIMGASKRVCEMVVQSKSRQEGVKTQFVTTRFGNVLGSNGSVIPLFRKQIEEGGPITVTHPEITRYFMTIPEACQLVLEAGFMGKGGEIFVFDMGQPVKIVDLANNMIRLSGLEPGKDIKIEYTGLRPGEKLFEELLLDKEVILPTHHQKIKIAKIEKVDFSFIIPKIDLILKNLYSYSEKEIFEFFEEIVPEYKSSKANSNGQFMNKKLHVDTKPEKKILVPKKIIR
jgi:FlaA1/EpsC-like NDP-sugar epimerase